MIKEEKIIKSGLSEDEYRPMRTQAIKAFIGSLVAANLLVYTHFLRHVTFPKAVNLVIFAVYTLLTLIPVYMARKCVRHRIGYAVWAVVISGLCFLLGAFHIGLEIYLIASG